MAGKIRWFSFHRKSWETDRCIGACLGFAKNDPVFCLVVMLWNWTIILGPHIP